ncbi:MAG TPA: sigma 54-interacting transcriptional regulator [Candidatus Methylomirabilis sp.]|nr:sigma 54-interacting transcriptional regulator [Candidatus Methylomirabilis sp.]
MSDAFDPRHAGLEAFQSADAAMRRCLELARIAARTSLPVLILGESGTGKTLLASAIHNSSKRAGHPFVSFNAAALSDTLLDSQLFGHEKGAFTGADKPVKGKFELADSGTLFIDEIADLSLAAQAKILRAVEYGEFERLGGETLRNADVRLISATHLPLGTFIRSDRFRKDLFYRISGITLTIPPLRERPEDLPALIAAEVAQASQQHGKAIIGLSKRAADALLTYHWPGNLRELKRVIHVAVAITDSDVVPAEAILFQPLDETPTGRGPGETGGTHPGEDLRLRAVEGRHIQAVLQQFGGNKRQAARALGISRSTLDRKLSA